MARSVYVAGVEGFTGKSAVALGVLEQLSRRVARVAIFRPVVRAEASTGEVHDYVLDLLVSHDAVSLSYDECAGVSYDEVHADPDGGDGPHRRALPPGRGAERRRGDRRAATTPTSALRRSSASTPGSRPTSASPVLLVLNGHGRRRRPAAYGGRDGRGRARRQPRGTSSPSSPTASTRRPPTRTAAALRRDGVPAFALPEQPLLSAPSVGDLMAACDGRLVRGDESQLAREVPGLVVAAMTLPNVLDRLFDGAARRHARRPPRGGPRRPHGAPVGQLPADLRASSSTAASSCPSRSAGCSTGST